MLNPTSISKTIKAHIPVVGCLATVLEQLQAGIDKSPIQIDRSAQEDWWRQIISWREQKCLSYNTDGDAIKPQAVIEAVYKATNGDAYVSSDVGQHQMFAAQYYPFKHPRQSIKLRRPWHYGLWLTCCHGCKTCFSG